MNATHTPGPWDIQPLGNGEAEIIANGPGRDDVACICSVAGGLGMSIEDGTDYESEANARLIAAAPRMIEGLKRIRDARDAIAKGDMSAIAPYECFDDWAADVADDLIRIAIGAAD